MYKRKNLIFFHYIKAYGINFANPVTLMILFEDNEFQAQIIQDNVRVPELRISVDRANFVKNLHQFILASPETERAWGISSLHFGGDLRLTPSTNLDHNVMPLSSFQFGEILRIRTRLADLARDESGEKFEIEVFLWVLR